MASYRAEHCFQIRLQNLNQSKHSKQAGQLVVCVSLKDQWSEIEAIATKQYQYQY
jgi:hypothetical protein